MSFLPHTARNSSDHSGLIAILIALPLTLAGTAFLTFLLDAGSRLGL
jgi:hypothetical protein